MNETTNINEKNPETITEKIAKKLEEIIAKKWWNISFKVNSESDKIEYNNRELWAWTVYQQSEVWDFDIWKWTYCVSLGDLTIFPEFFQAVKEVEKEEWINFHITESIWINDCLTIAWKKWINFKQLANDIWLKNEDSINSVLFKIKNDLSVFLKPEFEIKLKPFSNSLYIKVLWTKKEDIIKKSSLFMDKLQKITQYFDEHMDEIIQSFKNLASEEQKQNERIKKEQEDRLNNLQKQL